MDMDNPTYMMEHIASHVHLPLSNGLHTDLGIAIDSKELSDPSRDKERNMATDVIPYMDVKYGH